MGRKPKEEGVAWKANTAGKKVEAGPRALSGGVACWDRQRGGLSGGGRRGVGGRLNKKEKGAAETPLSMHGTTRLLTAVTLRVPVRLRIRGKCS